MSKVAMVFIATFQVCICVCVCVRVKKEEQRGRCTCHPFKGTINRIFLFTFHWVELTSYLPKSHWNGGWECGLSLAGHYYRREARHWGTTCSLPPKIQVRTSSHWPTLPLHTCISNIIKSHLKKMEECSAGDIVASTAAFQKMEELEKNSCHFSKQWSNPTAQEL